MDYVELAFLFVCSSSTSNTDSATWFFVYRIFGTDIGYKKLKASKRAEAEYSREQKEHWCTICFGSIQNQSVDIQFKGIVENVVSHHGHTEFGFLAVLVYRVRKAFYRDIYALFFR